MYGHKKNGVNRLNTLQKATDLKKKNSKVGKMKCTVTVKTVKMSLKFETYR